MRNFHDMNDALLVLLPKSAEASSVRDYRPIALIHIIGKLFSKVLASRLARRLGELVHTNQSEFIKGRVQEESLLAAQDQHCLGLRLGGMVIFARAAETPGIFAHLERLGIDSAVFCKHESSA
jgi:hypothetical protein